MEATTNELDICIHCPARTVNLSAESCYDGCALAHVQPRLWLYFGTTQPIRHHRYCNACSHQSRHPFIFCLELMSEYLHCNQCNQWSSQDQFVHGLLQVFCSATKEIFNHFLHLPVGAPLVVQHFAAQPHRLGIAIADNPSLGNSGVSATHLRRHR